MLGVKSLPIAVQRRPEGDASVKHSPKEGEEINHWLLEEGNSRQREPQMLRP